MFALIKKPKHLAIFMIIFFVFHTLWCSGDTIKNVGRMLTGTNLFLNLISLRFVRKSSQLKEIVSWLMCLVDDIWFVSFYNEQ